MRITVLGSGTSHGIPVLACSCPVCRSESSFDKRLRASLYVQGKNGESIVIDTGPEFRLQALRAGITRLDAILLTHAHADHVHGLDDVRPLCRENPLSVYGSRAALDEVRERFSYVFKETQQGGGKPRLSLYEAAATIRIDIGGLRITAIPVKHGDLDILGWKIEEAGSGGVLYLTDTSAIPNASWPLMGEAELLIIGALRKRPHATHFTFAEALETALRLKARRVRLTHLCHEHSHEEINAFCHGFAEERGSHADMAASYDGLVLEC